MGFLGLFFIANPGCEQERAGVSAAAVPAPRPGSARLQPRCARDFLAAGRAPAHIKGDHDGPLRGNGHLCRYRAVQQIFVKPFVSVINTCVPELWSVFGSQVHIRIRIR